MIVMYTKYIAYSITYILRLKQNVKKQTFIHENLCDLVWITFWRIKVSKRSKTKVIYEMLFLTPEMDLSTLLLSLVTLKYVSVLAVRFDEREIKFYLKPSWVRWLTEIKFKNLNALNFPLFTPSTWLLYKLFDLILLAGNF